MQPLIRLCSSASPADRLTAFSTLRAVTASAAVHRRDIASPAFLSAVTYHSHLEDPEAFLEWALTLHTVALSDSNKLPMAQCTKFIGALIKSLSSDSHCYQAVKYAASCLANISELRDAHFYLRTESDLFFQLTALCSTPDAEALREVTRLLANLSSNAENHTVLIQSKGLELIMDACCSHIDSHVRTYAAQVLCNVSAVQHNHSEMRTRGCINKLIEEYLVPLIKGDLSNEVGTAIRYAVKALGNLSLSYECHDSILTGGDVLAAIEQTVGNKATEVVFDDVYLYNKLLSNHSNARHEQNMRVRVMIPLIVETISKYSDLLESEPDSEASGVSALSEKRSHYQAVLAQGFSCLKHITYHRVYSPLIFESKEPLFKTCVAVISRALAARAIVDEIDVCGNELSYEFASFLNLLAASEDSLMMASSPELVSALFALCGHPHTETVAQTVSAVANLAEKRSTHEHLLEAMSMLIPKLSSIDVSIQREACRAVSNLCNSRSFHPELLAASSSFDYLGRLCRASDLETLRSASYLLQKLFSVRDNHSTLWAIKVLPSLQALSMTPQPLTRKLALLVLRDCASNPEFKLRLVEEGILPHISAVIAEGITDLTWACLETLRHLSLNRKIKRTILEQPQAVLLLQVLAIANDPASSVPLVVSAESILMSLTEYTENHEGLFAVDILGCLRHLSSAAEESILLWAVKGYSFLSASLSSLPNYELADVECLVRLLSWKGSVSKYAAAALGNLCLRREHAAQIWTSGGFTALAEVIATNHKASGNHSDLDTLSRLLCHLATEEGHSQSQVRKLQT